MIRSRCLRSAAVIAAVLLGVSATRAQAQDAPAPFSSPYSGTFTSTHMDTNSDGLAATRQNVRLLSGPFGPSTVEGLNEFAITGPGTCANGNAGILFTQVLGTSAPASLVQRIEQTGDLLILAQTSGAACFDLVTSTLFLQAAGQITSGTGALAGTTGTFSLTGAGTFLFFSAPDTFGPQQGTFEETLTRP